MPDEMSDVLMGKAGLNPATLARSLLSGKTPQDPKLEALRGDLAASTGRVMEIGQAREAAAGPAITALQAKAKEPAASYKAQELPDFKESGIDPKELQDTLGIVVTLAALGGLLTRQPLTAALNNFSAGIQGFVQGKQEVYKRELAAFKLNFEKAKTKNDDLWREVQQSMEKHKADVQGLKTDLEIILAQAGRQIELELVKRGDINSAIQQLEKEKDRYAQSLSSVARIVESAQAHADSLALRRDMQGGKGWQAFQKPDGTIVRVNVITGERGAVEGDTAGLTKPSAKGAAGGKAMTAMQSTMYEDVATGFFRLDKLKEIQKQTGELPVGSAFMKHQIEGGGLIAAMKDYAVNNTMPAGFQQADALLFGVAFDVASSRSGGRGQLSDSKIREVTRQMPVVGDAPETVTLKYELIGNQLETANATLPEQFQFDPVKKGPKGPRAGAQAGSPGGPAAGGVEFNGYHFPSQEALDKYKEAAGLQ